MTLGKRNLAGFIPNIKDHGLGATMGTGGRCGFAGVSKGGTAAQFYEFKSAADMLTALQRGPAVEQLLDLFEDGYDPLEPALSVKSVVYREIDCEANVGTATNPVNSGEGTATAITEDSGAAEPFLTRSYAIKVTVPGGTGTARYKICRNYDVVDPAHQVWSDEYKFVVTTDGPPIKSRIYVEDVVSGTYIEFAEVDPEEDFLVGDVWTWQSSTAAPASAKVLAALTALAQWRDEGGNGIGGTGDITLIGCDRQFGDADDWIDVHQIATDEWDDNIHPVQMVISVGGPTKSGTPPTYQIDTWLAGVVADAEDYRTVQIPTNSLLNGALCLSAVYVLRPTTDGSQVRHQCGAILGQKVRARWHWDIGWVERFGFRGASAVYPWNSVIDNMSIKPNESVEENRTATLNTDGHFLVAWPRAGFIRKVVTDTDWAMADNTSDYFKAPYYRVVGGIHVELRNWFATIAREPGISSNDAAALEAEINGSILAPRVVDPDKPKDAIPKPFNAAHISVWAEDDVLVTEELDYSLAIVPVGSKHQLAGYTQLRRSL
jgi:hypothetical protein